MIQEHYDAIKALLVANTNLAGKVYDSARKDTAGTLIRDTYLVLFGGSPDVLGDNRFSIPQLADAQATFVYTVRAVSVTPNGVRAIAGAAFSQLVGKVPTAAGRTLGFVRHTHSTDLAPDNSLQPPLFFGDDEYTVISYRGH